MPTFLGYIRYLFTPTTGETVDDELPGPQEIQQTPAPETSLSIVQPPQSLTVTIDDSAHSKIKIESDSNSYGSLSVSSENTQYDLDICYLTDYWFSQLTHEHRQWIHDFQFSVQEREARSPGYLPAKIREWDCDVAISNAWVEHGSEGPIWTPWRLVYWTDGSYFEQHPRSATGGIVFENRHEQLIAVALSFDISIISGSFDSELLTAIHAMRMGLQVAEDRIRNGDKDFVREIVIYLDCQRLVEWFRENKYSRQLGENIRDMFYWADQVERACIELKIFWVPKKGWVEPHYLADQVAKGQRGRAFGEACYYHGRRYVKEVLVDLPWMPIDRYVVREWVSQREEPKRPCKRQKTAHYK